MMGTPAADMMCLDVLTRTQETKSSLRFASKQIQLRRRVHGTTTTKREVVLPLNAHVPDGGGRWADEDDALLLTSLSKLGVLRQEAITRMHSLNEKKKNISAPWCFTLKASTVIPCLSRDAF